MTLLAVFIASFALTMLVMLVNAWSEHNASRSRLGVPIAIQIAQFNSSRRYRVTKRSNPNPFKPSTKGKQ